MDTTARDAPTPTAPEGTAKHCTGPEHEGQNPLPVSAFGKHSRSPDGLRTNCKECNNRDARRRFAANPGKYRQTRQRWSRANPEKRRPRNQRWSQANPESIRVKDRRLRDELRDQVFSHYGRACACCGATDNLCIDHINGDGKAHRLELFGRNVGASLGTYRWLINNDFPDGFQTLCKPCNGSKKDGPACRLDHSAVAS